MLVLDATAVGTVVTFYLARKADDVRAQALARTGRLDRSDPLTSLVVLLAGALGAVAFAWFFFGGGYTSSP
jgi:divalent metal cation (Fe/Co/Zn/Cd) transporter